MRDHAANTASLCAMRLRIVWRGCDGPLHATMRAQPNFFARVHEPFGFGLPAFCIRYSVLAVAKTSDVRLLCICVVCAISYM